MTVYFALGGWSGFNFTIDYYTGIRLSLGFIVFAISVYNLEVLIENSAYSMNSIIGELCLVKSLLKEKAPEDYEKLYRSLEKSIEQK